MKTQRDRKVLYLSGILVVCLVLTAVFGAMGYRLVRHERNQNALIQELSARISILESAGVTRTEAEAFARSCAENSAQGGYCYLAIGNSITKHPLEDYWWSECGMAASEPEKDYFHQVSAFLQERYADRKICSLAYTFLGWEILATDRAEVLKLLDGYLNENLDLVTVQLGENATDLSTWESDFGYLLGYIRRCAPKAQIIVVGDFWEYGERDRIKKRVAESCGAGYVDLSEIKDKEEYMAGLGTSVYGDDGAWHKIEHRGVAVHPGDNGMRYIAGQIIDKLDKPE